MPSTTLIPVEQEKRSTRLVPVDAARSSRLEPVPDTPALAATRQMFGANTGAILSPQRDAAPAATPAPQPQFAAPGMIGQPREQSPAPVGPHPWAGQSYTMSDGSVIRFDQQGNQLPPDPVFRHGVPMNPGPPLTPETETARRELAAQVERGGLNLMPRQVEEAVEGAVHNAGIALTDVANFVMTPVDMALEGENREAANQQRLRDAALMLPDPPTTPAGVAAGGIAGGLAPLAVTAPLGAGVGKLLGEGVRAGTRLVGGGQKLAAGAGATAETIGAIGGTVAAAAAPHGPEAVQEALVGPVRDFGVVIGKLASGRADEITEDELANALFALSVGTGSAARGVQAGRNAPGTAVARPAETARPAEPSGLRLDQHPQFVDFVRRMEPAAFDAFIAKQRAKGTPQAEAIIDQAQRIRGGQPIREAQQAPQTPAQPAQPQPPVTGPQQPPARQTPAPAPQQPPVAAEAPPAPQLGSSRLNIPPEVAQPPATGKITLPDTVGAQEPPPQSTRLVPVEPPAPVQEPPDAPQAPTQAPPQAAPVLSQPQGLGTLTSANLRGSMIQVAFDASESVPTAAKLNDALRSVPGFEQHEFSVTQFDTDIISGTQGVRRYRIDVISPQGNLSSAEAAKLYQTLFGSDQPFRSKSAFERAGTLEERMTAAQRTAVRSEEGFAPVGESAQPAPAQAPQAEAATEPESLDFLEAERRQKAQEALREPGVAKALGDIVQRETAPPQEAPDAQALQAEEAPQAPPDRTPDSAPLEGRQPPDSAARTAESAGQEAAALKPGDRVLVADRRGDTEPGTVTKVSSTGGRIGVTLDDGNKVFKAAKDVRKMTDLPPPPPQKGSRLRGGREAGDTILVEKAADEIKALLHRAATTTARAARSVRAVGGRILLRGTTWMARLPGDNGKKMARDLTVIDRKAAKRANTAKLDARDVLSGVGREDRKRIAKAINKRPSQADAPAHIRRRADALREILDRDLNEARKLGVTRRMPDGSRIPVGGSGKAFPQVPNAEGREFLESAEKNGLADPKVYTVAREMVMKGRADTLDAALAAIRAFRDSQLRGVNRYFETTRFELPEHMVEWDPAFVLPALFERNALFVEGVRRWGDDFKKAKALLEKIRADTKDPGIAEVIDNFIGHHFGAGGKVIRADTQLAGTLSNYETITKLGFSLLSVARNIGQRFANTTTYPASVQLKAMAYFPPIINRFIPAARRLGDQMERSGAVRTRTALADVETAIDPLSPWITRAAMMPFSAAERGNQAYTALVARFGLERDLALLAKLDSKGRAARMIRTIMSLGGDSRAAIVRRVEQAGIKSSRLAEAIRSGKPLTEAEFEAAMVKLVTDTQFPLTIVTERIWWSNHPWLRLMGKFKQFGVEQVGMIYTRVVREAAKGNFRPLVNFLIATMIVGEIYNIARDAIKGSEESLTLRMLNRPDQRNPAAIAARIGNNIIDGGGVGIMADLFWGVSDFIGGPAAGTAQRAMEAAADTVRRPGQALDAAREFARDEIVIVKQAEGVIDRIESRFQKQHNRGIQYAKWRRRAFEFRDEKKPEGMVQGWLLDALEGMPDFSRTDRSLQYEYAARQVTAGDVDDAADYLATLLRDAKDQDEHESILKGMKISMRSKSPLGPVSQKERDEWLGRFTPKDQQEALELQQEWLHAYEDAIERAKAKAGE